MLPTSGPFTRTVPVGVSELYFKRTNWMRQKQPYDLRLPFDMEHIVKTYPNSTYRSGEAASSASRSSWVSPSYNHAFNKAYNKFKESVGTTAQLAVDIAERKKAAIMIVSRAAQLTRFTKYMARFQFSKAAAELGLEVTKRRGTQVWVRSNHKLASNDARHRKDPFWNPKSGQERELTLKRSAKSRGKNYLEFHFGWEPLVKSIGDSMEILQSPVFAKLGRKCRGRGVHKTPQTPSGTHGSIIDYGVPLATVYDVYEWKTSIDLRAYVLVNDPNLYKWNALGFVNPLSIIWELVPFSFVLDWIGNIGDCLASWTDWVGLTLSQATTSEFTNIWRQQVYRRDYTDYPIGADFKYVEVKRTLGIASPTLSLRPPKWPSMTRAVTAISLLTLALRTN